MAFAQREARTMERPAGDTIPQPIEDQPRLGIDRPRRQLGLFLAGAGFFALSALITRRSLVRRYKASIPAFYQPNNRPNSANGATDALEALNIATINVTSLAMMLTGSMLYVFDIASLADLRRKIRGGLGVDGTGRTENEAQEEFEEWLASVLARKSKKENWAREAQQDSQEKTD
ncbi:hypothetical protein FGG08_004591 [Glutinoglossum americanum]|uniref:Altered inheritance of mitochondria protein 11 n=1 Tax=Glutinoglossum americanum TaxID=1670608 RepID=A0A9P8KWV9_9PEZI|nr:hypothetical protein FGG08_004591 [Glutinoglossum americanum]